MSIGPNRYGRSRSRRQVSRASFARFFALAQGIPTILEPIFEPVFDEANFGYRRGRSTKDAMRKVWKEIKDGREWIVDADLKDFFGSVDHAKLLMLVSQRIADGRVLGPIEAMLKAGSYGIRKAGWFRPCSVTYF